MLRRRACAPPLSVLLVTAATLFAACSDDPNTPVDGDVADVSDDATDAVSDAAPDAPPEDTGAEVDVDGPDADDADASPADVSPDAEPDADADPDAVADADAEIGADADADADEPPPAECGNAVIEEGEECDDGNDLDTDECLSDCTLAWCGDGVVNRTFGSATYDSPLIVDLDGVEAYVCDDGSSCPARSAPTTCDVSELPGAAEHGICQTRRFERAASVTWGGGLGGTADRMHHAYNWECFGFVCTPGVFRSYDADCGSGEMLARITCEGVIDEECDDGEDNGEGPDQCRSDCTLPRCGDGIVDSVEQCDEGFRENRDAPDACRRNCMLPACGDGILDSGEACDEGFDNADAADACRTSCALPRCGDGIVDSTEECDDGNEEDLDGCSNLCRRPGCGDGVHQPSLGEECDDGNDVDDDGCSNSCRLPTCGDGLVNTPAEECDDGNLDDLDACRNSCTLPVCGDRVRSTYPVVRVLRSPVVTGPTGATGRVCDDGGSCEARSCDVSNNGSAPEHGICQALGYQRAVSVRWGGGAGETDASMPHAYNWSCTNFVCGPSTNTYDRDNCNAAAMLDEIRCLDVFTEQCDLGDANADVPGARCRTTCLLPACPDGVRDEVLGEECDDGNRVQDDGCSNTCRLPQCGDGVVQAGETCDDGDTIDSNACRNDCTAHRCGDGVVADAEQCDDGDHNSDAPDAACRTNCTLPRCGDAIVDTGEECDDGNDSDRDACTTLCLLPVCGDGFRQRALGEECDDGNRVAGDGCSPACTREAGAAQGHVVYIGHDFFSSNPDMHRLVGNAVLDLPGVGAEVRVLGYDQYADISASGEANNTDAAVRARAAELGVTVTIDRLRNWSEFGARAANYDVLLVYEPENSGNSLSLIADTFAPALTRFLDEGGVIVICDFISDGWRFAANAGLIPFNGGGGSGGTMTVALPDDPIALDLAETYVGPSGTGYVVLDPAAEVDVVVTDSSGRAIVVHRYW